MPELDDQVVIDSRYRILRHVGSGGMADVYCAEDTHLGRHVAVKLLYRRFAQDSEFVERFRREASAAAALQHPNVVSVYDRGEYDGTYYIAMEYCEGPSLKELITREAPLDAGRAIELTLQILVAARFAHRRGVIHRDLKPQNVIVDTEDGEDGVKVADFGIARAGASEITEVGAIMGTAQYLSPEQAQGKPVTAASDLYSIGVVLYEMLTGRAPFEGDSAVAIALKHVSQPPPPLRDLRPDVPPRLEAVVSKALAKEPADRYQEADSFIRDLQAVRATLGPARAGDGGSTEEFAPVVLPIAPPPASPPKAAAPPGPPVPVAPPPAGDISPPAPPPEPPEIGEETQEPHGRGRRRLILALAGVGVLAALALLAFLLLKPDQATVPVVIGEQLSGARDKLEQAGFEVDIDRRPDATPRDTVFQQAPRGGGKADKGSTVSLFVSNGPSTVKVPDVLGLTEDDARRRVRRAGLKPATRDESTAKVAAGNVIRSDPGAGTAIERGSRVTLFISSGPEEVTVPDVSGQDQTDAVARLRAAGLSVIVRERESSEPVDTVVDQTPAAGQVVDEGTQVTLFVSNGKVEAVPDVVGLEQGEAETELRSAGFRPSVRTTSVDQPDEDGRVISQTPAGGRERSRGGTVVITVGSFTAPEGTPPSTPGPTG